jgi:hypothetical protein
MLRFKGTFQGYGLKLRLRIRFLIKIDGYDLILYFELKIKAEN